MTDSAGLLTLATTIALEAGELAASLRAEGVDVAASKSSAEDIVTLADRQTEKLIRSRISAARPDDGFLGEESDAATGTSGLTWVVDPIDGTVNYFYGIPQYAVSIAVVEGEPNPTTWRALAAAVVNPATGEVFTAERGGGAWLGSDRLAVAPPVQLAQALVATGFGYLAETRIEQAKLLVELIGRVRDIRRFGAASLDLCAVAAGRVNGYFERGLNPWDHAAGALIAQEAGAVVQGLDGGPADARLLLAAQPDVAREIAFLLHGIRT